MPLNVTPYAQRREYGCLPACLRTVRDYYDERLTDTEASELCGECSDAENPGGGCDWDGGIESLANTYPINTFTSRSDSLDEAWDKLYECVETDRRLTIVHLRWGGVSGGKHAVVVYGVHDDYVDIMNPYFEHIDYDVEQPGRLEEILKAKFLAQWDDLGLGAIYFED